MACGIMVAVLCRTVLAIAVLAGPWLGGFRGYRVSRFGSRNIVRIGKTVRIAMAR